MESAPGQYGSIFNNNNSLHNPIDRQRLLPNSFHQQIMDSHSLRGKPRKLWVPPNSGNTINGVDICFRLDSSNRLHHSIRLHRRSKRPSTRILPNGSKYNVHVRRKRYNTTMVTRCFRCSSTYYHNFGMDIIYSSPRKCSEETMERWENVV